MDARIRMEKGPGLKLRIFFWIILGTFSVFFAEVFAGSQLFPFFNVWGLGVVYPLYAVHLLVLGSFVFLKGKPRLYTLFPAGAIFGLYEAYITKVIWQPGWGDAIVTMGGIAVVETMVLVLFWHAFMAFIAPLLIGEIALTSGSEVRDGLPAWVKKVFGGRKRCLSLLIILAAIFGIFHSLGAQSPQDAILSGLSSGFVLLVLMYLWRRTSGPKYTMRELLPGKRAIWVFFAMLLVIYAVLGAVLNPQLVPGLMPQFLVWVMYAVFFAALGLGLKWSRKAKVPKVRGPPVKFSLKLFTAMFVIFALSSLFTEVFFPPLAVVSVFVIWVLGVVLGLIVFILGLKNFLKRK